MSITKRSVLAAILVLAGLWAVVQAAQQPGTWVNVTPANMKMSGDFTNGPIAANADVVRPQDIYVQVQEDGCWKSTDYGVTWNKVSKAGSPTGRQWYAAIDKNPNRDPATSPTLYMTSGYGAGGIWKSVNGGVDWTSVWNNNIYKSDGTTNISSDVGNDLTGVMITDASGPNNLIAFLHGYWGTGNNNGVFHSTDGGAKWLLRVTPFGFSAHGDVVFPYDKTTWIENHGTGWPNSEFYRTTDEGATWNHCSGSFPAGSIGRDWTVVGSTIYAGSDYTGGMFKSADKGASWKKLPLGSAVTWVVATATKAYASDGRDNPHILQASLSNDEVWTDAGNPNGMGSAGSRATVTFDGTNYIIIAAQEAGGLWRYVEPATTTAFSHKASTVANRPAVFPAGHSIISSANGSLRVIVTGKSLNMGRFYDVKGRNIGAGSR